jgi:hypothetical protein
MKMASHEIQSSTASDRQRYEDRKANDQTIPKPIVMNEKSWWSSGDTRIHDGTEIQKRIGRPDGRYSVIWLLLVVEQH